MIKVESIQMTIRNENGFKDVIDNTPRFTEVKTDRLLELSRKAYNDARQKSDSHWSGLTIAGDVDGSTVRRLADI